MTLTTALRVAGVAWMALGLQWLGHIKPSSPLPALLLIGAVVFYEFVLVRQLGKWEAARGTPVTPPIKFAIIAASVVVSLALSPVLLPRVTNVVDSPKTEADCLREAKSANSDYIAKKLLRECRAEIQHSQERASLDERACMADAVAMKNAPPENEKMALARSKIPELQGMDDQRALRYLHNVYYSDVPLEDLAHSMGVVPPPPYRDACMRHFPTAYR